MWDDIKSIYGSAGAFALACPLLFLIPVLVELAQHVVEIRAGMYLGPEQAQAAEGDQMRLYFGFAKTIALTLPGYWFVRYVMFDRSAAGARAVEWPAAGLFGVILLVMALQSWLALFAPSLAETIGLSGTASTVFSVVETIVLQIVTIYLFAWMVAWPLGKAAIGPIRSIGVMHGSFWYALGLFVGAFLPLMVVHYALAATAILTGGPALDWALMALDSIVVGFLALNLAGATVYATRHAAGRKGIALLPPDRAEPAFGRV